MAHDSAWSTPDGTIPSVQVVESSTPVPKAVSNVYKELSTTNFLTTPRPTGKFARQAGTSYRARLRLLSRMMCFTIVMMTVLWWRLNRGKERAGAQENANSSPPPITLEGLKFIDADHPYIRYVGRWTSTADRSLQEGSFPGVYFEFAVSGSKTVLLCLHNTDRLSRDDSVQETTSGLTLSTANASTSEPISLLARVDDDEYHILLNSSLIVTIRAGTLNITGRHDIRIIAPMVGGRVETLQVEGLWIDEGGQLLSFQTELETGTQSREYEETTEQIRSASQSDRKMLEIITDIPGSMAMKAKRGVGDAVNTRGLLGGVLGWEYLLGEMFASDHVSVGMEGMCLVRECIGGQGAPTGIADVFFQSGPVGSKGFSQPWPFEAYLPAVMVINVGHADWESFHMNSDQYNKTIWELSIVFEDTYISFIKAIRALAYPVRLSRHGDAAINLGPAIFVMRPFHGQFEQATRSVVDRLRSEGDRRVFWLDTSGWLEEEDFSLDKDVSSILWRLTERGNQRVAILLHFHVCRYLARDSERCVFLPPEVYEGRVIDSGRVTIGDQMI